MSTEQEIYKQALTRTCLKALFEIYAVLTGRAEGARYQLTADQHVKAHECFRHLYGIVRRPRLQRTPISRARDDAAFQRFLAGITRRRRQV